jgi:predicted O-methyltransferase YrrM
VDRLLADPPAVHAMAEDADAAIGLWSTARDCYLLLAEHAGPSSRSLETGAGLSTVLLAALGARHTCVTPSAEEAARLVAFCGDRGIDTSSVTFRIGASDDVLPGLTGEGPLDLVFIDGGHGFPTPMIDWYYAGGRLRMGGLLVLDDIALPAVAQLRAFLDADPRFVTDRCTPKWASYRRRDNGSLREDWFEQPFFTATPPTWGALPMRTMRKLRRTWKGRKA